MMSDNNDLGGVSAAPTALSSLRDQAPSGLDPDGLQSADAVQDVYDIIILHCEHDPDWRERGAAALRTVNRLKDRSDEAEAALDDCVGALQFILAFYEPGQRYLDTEAWKQACASGVRAYQRGATALGWTLRAMRADNGSVYYDHPVQVTRAEA